MDDIKEYLDAHEKKDLLRFLTCGSVDNGKSTLIGRLLYDSKLIFEDQFAALKRDSGKAGTTGAGKIDYALLLDGLKAEREQGITIDVAYRYFATPKRKFIIADCPGHEQYTRNMATGASTADLAIILIDARHGIVTQTKRHAFIVSLLGIRHVIVAVNKIDLVDYSEARFNEIRDEFAALAEKLGIPHVYPIPISALEGVNVVNTSPEKTPYYRGKSLLETLETADVQRERNLRDFRFGVQLVIRPNLNFRGFAGTVLSGVVRKGDAVRAFPSGKKTFVKSIVTADGELDEAFPPQAVVLTLRDEIDVSSGDVIAAENSEPEKSSCIIARIVWMSQNALVPNREYLLRHGSRFFKATVKRILRKIDVNTLENSPADALPLNGIGDVVVQTTNPLFFDAYAKNRATGRFILVDPKTNETAGAGTITSTADDGNTAASRIPGWWNGNVLPRERVARLKHRPRGILFRGKNAHRFAAELEERLFRRDLNCYLLSVPEDAENRRERFAELRQTALALIDAGFIFITAVRENDPDEDALTHGLKPLVVAVGVKSADAKLTVSESEPPEKVCGKIRDLLVFEGVLPFFNTDCDYAI